MFPKPLPNRKNYVISRNPDLVIKEAHVINQNIQESIETLIEECKQESKILWVIGGAEIIQLLLPYKEEYHLTVFDETYDCDKFIQDPQKFGFLEKSYDKRKDSTKYIYSK